MIELVAESFELAKIACISSLCLRAEISKDITVFDESGNHFFCFHSGFSFRDLNYNIGVLL